MTEIPAPSPLAVRLVGTLHTLLGLLLFAPFLLKRPEGPEGPGVFLEIAAQALFQDGPRSAILIAVLWWLCVKATRRLLATPRRLPPMLGVGAAVGTGVGIVWLVAFGVVNAFEEPLFTVFVVLYGGVPAAVVGATFGMALGALDWAALKAMQPEDGEGASQT